MRDETIAAHAALMAVPMDGRAKDPGAVICRRCGCPGANLCRHLCLTDSCGRREVWNISFVCPCCCYMDEVVGHDAAEGAKRRVAAREAQTDFFHVFET